MLLEIQGVKARKDKIGSFTIWMYPDTDPFKDARCNGGVSLLKSAPKGNSLEVCRKST